MAIYFFCIISLSSGSKIPLMRLTTSKAELYNSSREHILKFNKKGRAVADPALNAEVYILISFII